MRSIRGWLENHQPLIDVSIAAHGDVQRKSYRGLIDTGATRTCITQRVTIENELPPRGKLLVASATNYPERRMAYGYSLGLLCEKLGLEKTLFVLDHEFIAPQFIDNGNFDVLIGMDIISRGTLILRPTGEFTFELDL